MNTPPATRPTSAQRQYLSHYDKGRNGRHPEEIHHSRHPKQGHEGPSST